MYIHQLKDQWPNFTWDEDALPTLIGKIEVRQRELLVQIEKLGIAATDRLAFESQVQDVVSTSEIEGDMLGHSKAGKAILRRLCVGSNGLSPAERSIDGLVAVTLDSKSNYELPLTEQRLFYWHKKLFPTGRSDVFKIKTGQWRDDTMQIVSGPEGHRNVHYEAPAAAAVPQEMKAFLDWFNKKDDTHPLIRSAIAHMWFVAIHPFDDGNGRIARAIADMELSRMKNGPNRFYSISTEMRKDRDLYYKNLEETMKGGINVTQWLRWYMKCVNRAIARSEVIVAGSASTYGGLSKKERQELSKLRRRLRRGLPAEPTPRKLGIA